MNAALLSQINGSTKLKSVQTNDKSSVVGAGTVVDGSIPSKSPAQGTQGNSARSLASPDGEAERLDVKAMKAQLNNLFGPPPPSPQVQTQQIEAPASDAPAALHLSPSAPPPSEAPVSASPDSSEATFKKEASCVSAEEKQGGDREDQKELKQKKKKKTRATKAEDGAVLEQPVLQKQWQKPRPRKSIALEEDTQVTVVGELGSRVDKDSEMEGIAELEPELALDTSMSDQASLMLTMLRNIPRLLIQIPSCRWVEEGRGSHITYKIQLAFQKRSHTLSHRFSQFESLHKQLERKWSKMVKLPKFPSKSVVSVGKLSSEQLEARRGQLEVYLQEVVATINWMEEMNLREFLDVPLWARAKKRV